MSEKSRIYVPLSNTREGVDYSYTAAGSGQPATHAPSAEVTARRPLPWDLLGGLRNRFDLNFSDGDFDPRYRGRLRLERNIALGKPTLTPYAYGEFFYSLSGEGYLNCRAPRRHNQLEIDTIAPRTTCRPMAIRTRRRRPEQTSMGTLHLQT